jgi:crossover junction endodeoxyribonuclease RusA
MQKFDKEFIDSALDDVLKAAGSGLKNYTMPQTIQRMRGAMGDALKATYSAGRDDCHKALTEPKITIKLPWPPVGLSPNARIHYHKLALLKKVYRKQCGIRAVEQGAKQMHAESLRLTLTFYPPTRRKYDKDNALASIKSGLDGLADVLGVDDSNWELTIKKGGDVGGFVLVEIYEV